MKKYLTICFAVFASFLGCEEDLLTYDVNSGQTLIGFDVTSANLEVVIDSEGTLVVPVNSTTVSNMDRTFDVRVVPEGTTANPATYSVGSIVIPANSFVGTLTIQGFDNDVETTAETLELAIVEGDDYVTGPNLTVSIFQVCPVDKTSFVGSYKIETVSGSGVFGCAVFPEGGTVNLQVGGSDLQRVFTAEYILDCAFGSFPTQFTFNLVCNEIIVGYKDTGVGCGGNSVNLSVGQGSTAGTYDATDDSSFTLNVTDNVDSDCGGGPVQASYTFTKV